MDARNTASTRPSSTDGPRRLALGPLSVDDDETDEDETEPAGKSRSTEISDVIRRASGDEANSSSLPAEIGDAFAQSTPEGSAEGRKSPLGMMGAPLLETAPIEDTDRPLPISLASALRLSDARPLIVAAAQASAWVAEAQLQRAKVLWVPTFDLGAVYYRHDGFGPDFNRGVNNSTFGLPGGGGPLNQNLNYFYGYGSFYESVNLTDAIFEPLAAKQVLDSGLKSRRQKMTRSWPLRTPTSTCTSIGACTPERSRPSKKGANWSSASSISVKTSCRWSKSTGPSGRSPPWSRKRPRPAKCGAFPAPI
jgi:hypothetical protein